MGRISKDKQCPAGTTRLSRSSVEILEWDEERSARQATAAYGWEMCKCVMSTDYKYARSYPLMCVWVDFRAVSPCF